MDFFHTSISPAAIARVTETLKSTFLSEGVRVREFENELTKRLGLINPTAVNSGTAALHLGLITAGVGEGDEVIIPAQTFIATGMAVLYMRAKPVFADIQYSTGNIDPLSIEQKITPRTKALIPVHWGGYPCDMDKIHAIAKRHNIIVFEDAAHALGATYKGKSVGSLSPFTAFSFQAIKHFTTGDGGALCCLDEHDAQSARTRRWFGIDRANSTPSILGEREYDVSEVGYKYHMNDLAASVGLGNLAMIEETLNRRRAISARYRQELKDIPGLTLLDYQNDRESSYWLFTILVERRIDFIKKLHGHGIPVSVVHLRIDHNSVFGGIMADLPGQEKFNAQQVAIPNHQGLTNEEVDTVIQTIRQGW